jgi:hypothetical protein
MIYEDIRGELDLAAAEWFKLSGKTVGIASSGAKVTEW